MQVEPGRHGLMAEFSEPQALVEATQRAWETGFRQMDAYTPFPLEGLPERLGFHRTGIPLLVLVGGLTGACLGYWMQYWMSVVDYPLNVGGRPLHSWPAFIPVTFELGVLFAALTALLGMLALSGLPMPYHPVFNVPEFRHASQDRFFLCIEARDPQFDLQQTRRFLESVGADRIHDVPE